MKKILKNKKGFTLVELLAVIVVLAIIMVIATQQVGKAINNARANSFVESYQMIVKQANLFISQDDTVTCGGTSETDCLSHYNLSDDYTLSVTDDSANKSYVIKLGIDSNGKFKNLDLTKYGKYFNGSSCSAAKVGSNATSCSDKEIIGKIPY